MKYLFKVLGFSTLLFIAAFSLLNSCKPTNKTSNRSNKSVFADTTMMVKDTTHGKETTTGKDKPKP